MPPVSSLASEQGGSGRYANAGARTGRFATGTSPTGFSGWRATHPNPVGACPQHIRSSTGCLYEGSEVDSASDGRAFSIEERDAELVKRIKLLQVRLLCTRASHDRKCLTEGPPQTCRFSHAETGLVIYDPVTVWYLRLPDHLYGYRTFKQPWSTKLSTDMNAPVQRRSPSL